MNNKKRAEKNGNYEMVLEKLMKLINIYSESEANPRTYGTDEHYYSLEIHTIHIIGKNRGINLTDIAHWHGISKSAVSKVVKKLESKGAVLRYKAPDNNKEVLFELTEKGERAYLGHLEYHQWKEGILVEQLKKVPDKKLQDFMEVLGIFIAHGETFAKE